MTGVRPFTAGRDRPGSLSQAKGQIYNRFGDEWQDLIDNLHELAKVHGPISKVDLIQSHDGNQWLNFIIYYDNLEGGKKFVHLMDVLNNLQPLNHLINLQYTSSPAAADASSPEPN